MIHRNSDTEGGLFCLLANSVLGLPWYICYPSDLRRHRLMAYAPMFELWRRFEEDAPYDLVLDLGHGEDFPLRTHPWFFGVRIPLTQADEHGLPIPEEAERLNLVENRIREAVKARDGMYVGRRTGGGARDLLFYVDSKPRGLEDRLRMTVGTDILYISRPDPQWQGYESLLPEPREWREMEDRRLLIEVIEEGADPEALHRLIHRVETPSAKGALALKGLFEKLGLLECQVVKGSEGHTVVGTQECMLQLDDVHKVAWVLESRAPKARGHYLGWALASL